MAKKLTCLFICPHLCIYKICKRIFTYVCVLIRLYNGLYLSVHIDTCTHSHKHTHTLYFSFTHLISLSVSDKTLYMLICMDLDVKRELDSKINEKDRSTEKKPIKNCRKAKERSQRAGLLASSVLAHAITAL